MASHVRRIGTLTTADGERVDIGVDHDLLTWRGPAYVALDDRARAELHGLNAAATLAIDEYKRVYGEDE